MLPCGCKTPNIMPIQLNLVLFSKEQVRDIAQALDHEAIEEDNPYRFKKLDLSGNLPFECQAFFRTTESREPACKGFLEPFFYDDSFSHRNKHLAVAIILKDASGRVFAATFGAGGTSCLSLDRIEPRFGLETTLSLAEFTTIDTRRLDSTSQQMVTRFNRGEKNITAFNVQSNKDLITRIRGRAKDGMIRMASGADSLSVTLECKMEELAVVCDALLEIFLAKSYTQDDAKRQVVDKLSPLPRNHHVAARLERSLRELFYARQLDKVDFDWPEGIRDELRIENFRLSRRRKHVFLDASLPRIESVADFIGSLESGLSLDKILVSGLDCNGKVVTGTHPLSKCIAAELDINLDTYLHIAGQWYRVGRDYINQLRQQVDGLPDLTADLNLPGMSSDEGIYNAEISEQRGWVLLDKKYYYISNDKFEHSDLIDLASRRYICVKKGTSSQDLVYLFHQAALSAKMMRLDPAFCNHVVDKIAETGIFVEKPVLEQGTYVLAVATAKSGKFSDALFLPSLIVLGDYIDRIRGHGFSVAVCRFPLSVV